MPKITLTKSQVSELKKIQKKTKDKSVHCKIATILGLNEGINYSTLSRILSLDESTLRRYESEYFSKGLIDFLESNYRGYFGKLSSIQISLLIKELRVNLYSTSQEIAFFIKQRFGVNYAPKGLIPLLHRIGFVYKKTKLVPSKANSKAQEDFVEQFTILRENLKEDEIIYFGDSVHPQHNTNISRAWIPKGEERRIKSNSGRTRVNLNGVLDVESKTVIIEESSRVNSDSTINLFQKIEEQHRDKNRINITLDNAGYYKSQKIINYLKTSKIKLIFLPSYSPNLNLIERLWKFMKQKVINNKFYEKSKDFRKAILDFFEKLENYKDELDKLLTYNFQIIDSG